MLDFHAVAGVLHVIGIKAGGRQFRQFYYTDNMDALAAGAMLHVTATYKDAPAPVKTIFSTKHEATFFNWILFFLGFGWIWMWF